MYDHTMDPSGDVVLTLKNPNAPFALVTADDSVTFLVSSRHLILASPVLKAALTGGWKEGITSDASHIRGISSSEWDVEAMTILMSIIHHRWSQVPRVVDLELLGKIAIVVDYYQINETVQLMGELWIERLLQKPLPDSYGRELLLWMCVSSVYKDHAIFKHATEVAIWHCPRDVETLQLPIPLAAIARINELRREIPFTITNSLEQLKSDYLWGFKGCNDACRSIQIGALMMKTYSLDLQNRCSGQPLQDGLSLARLVESIRGMETPLWHGHDSDCAQSYRSSLSLCLCRAPHTCRSVQLGFVVGLPPSESSGILSEYAQALASRVEGQMEGLDLSGYI
ncbi:hypothetical protein B0T25DRAFT_505640 [Lasiosphaeria hispida]|uniref:BTB domain-containing protein n=1 Tax=Lasiosphaeria hispida TaxID=260671 RepID=A0AAJ0MD31_9PEZI|nr:hypothetical protein B0T25DRAFT_505640 [Lasiosphaeria hispida]